MPIAHDEKYMRRCLQIARGGEAAAPPNPLVGAVVVYEGRIIGEGFHRKYGGPHAEVNAIAAVADKSLLPQSTLYVNLEPCSHFGKTPPCCDLIIRHGIRRVVVGMTDPFAEVMGRGIERMRAAGIEVRVGVCEDECRRLNRAFIVPQLCRRPYVVLKWAQSADGYIDARRSGGRPMILSTPHSAMHVHQMRAASDCILVGHRTAMLDNPSLNVRHWVGSDPTRIVISPHTPLPTHLNLLADGRRTIVIGSPTPGANAAVEFVSLPLAPDGSLPISTLLECLYEKGFRRLMVEGGSTVLSSFLNSDLWDEAWVEHAPAVIHDGVPAPAPPTQAFALHLNIWGAPTTHYTNPHTPTA